MAFDELGDPFCTWPTQASSYVTGRLEILGIRERYLAARGCRRGGNGAC